MSIRRDNKQQHISALLDRLTENSECYFPQAKGRPRVSAVTFMTRPLSDLAQARLQFDGSLVTVYVKIHKKARTTVEEIQHKVQIEFETLSRLSEQFQSIPGCAVVRPIVCFPQELAIITEAGEGDNFHRLIKQHTHLWSSQTQQQVLETYGRATGVWLRHFQQFTTQPRSAPLPIGTLHEQITSSLQICTGMGFPSADAARVMRFCEEQLGRVEDQRFPVIGEHPDFQPDNILVAPAGVTVLDFTSFRYGSAYSDLARFLIALDFLLKNPLQKRKSIKALMSAFLHGYGWPSSMADPGLAVHVIRNMLWTAKTVSAWPYTSPIKRFVEWRVAHFLSSWCRNITDNDNFNLSSVLLQ